MTVQGGSFVFGSTGILAGSGVGYMLLKIDYENFALTASRPFEIF